MSDKSLATVRQDGLLPASEDWRTMMTMASEFVKSGLLPEAVKTPAAALVIIQKGRELGLPPMAALSGISVIKGKPTASAELMLSLIYRDHGDDAIRVVSTDAAECLVYYKRRAWKQAQEFRFTIQDAEQAGLTTGPNRDTWKKYGPAMLRARCISAVARMAFPDSIAGMYTPEELGGDPQVSAEDVTVWREKPQATPQQTITEVVDADTGEIVDAQPARLPDKAITKLEQYATTAGVSYEQMTADAIERYGRRDYIELTMDEAADYAEWLKALMPESPKIADPSSPMTPNQKRYIESLARDTGMDQEGLNQTISQRFDHDIDQLSKAEASSLIEALQAMKDEQSLAGFSS